MRVEMRFQDLKLLILFNTQNHNLYKSGSFHKYNTYFCVEVTFWKIKENLLRAAVSKLSQHYCALTQ